MNELFIVLEASSEKDGITLTHVNNGAAICIPEGTHEESIHFFKCNRYVPVIRFAPYMLKDAMYVANIVAGVQSDRYERIYLAPCGFDHAMLREALDRMARLYSRSNMVFYIGHLSAAQ